MNRWVCPPALVLLALILPTLAGCATPVGVRPVGEDKTLEMFASSALTSNTLSHQTVETLAAYGLHTRYRSDFEQVLVELFERTRLDRNPNGVFALTELYFLYGRRHNSKPHYLAAAFFAYIYLFHPAVHGVRQPFDPRFRLTCDLYNRALTEAFRDDDGEFRFEGGLFLMPFGRLRVRAERPGFPWGEKEFNHFLPAYDYRVRGLWNRHRNLGLGVPLIAERTTQSANDLMAKNAKVAATAFLRLDLSQEKALAGDLEATLELYAPFNTLEITVEGQEVPLEADLTAPLAYSLDDGRLFSFELGAFFSADYAPHQLGIFMVQPYSPGKIPVVFVHGTASSPARWAQMFNALQSDRELRENCQFYFFIYSTGSPVTYSGHLLREALAKIQRTNDPDGKDPMLQQMVVVGHSQGGLLTRLQVTDSGDRFWDQLSDEPIEDLGLPPKEDALLRGVMFFEPVPAVKRVIFIATPHQGSFLSGTWYSRLAASMMRLPRRVTRATTDLLKHDATSAIRKRLGGRVPTSLDSMDPASGFVEVLRESPVAPEVTYHSIIPVAGGGRLADENDGVVEYKSAHLDGAASEFIVRSPHSCQDNPLTVIEVQRILHEHLSAVKTVETAQAAKAAKAAKPQ